MTAHLHDHLDTIHTRLRDSRLAMFGLNRLPRVYERAFGWLGEPLYQRVARDAAEAAGLAAGDLVVDVGTGPGRVPRLLHRLRPDLQVEGIDVSVEMIDGARATAARDEAATQGSGVLRYSVGDVAELPYPDHSVALVVSSLSLHHWPDAEAGIAEIRRVLRPGAQAWVYDVKPQLARTLRQLEAIRRPGTDRAAASTTIRQAGRSGTTSFEAGSPASKSAESVLEGPPTATVQAWHPAPLTRRESSRQTGAAKLVGATGVEPAVHVARTCSHYGLYPKFAQF